MGFRELLTLPLVLTMLGMVPGFRSQSCPAEDGACRLPAPRQQDNAGVGGTAEVYLECTASTTHWGTWAADIPPVVTVSSGSVVRVQSYTAVNFWWLHEEAGYVVPDAMKAIHEAGCLEESPGDRFPCGRIGPHLLSGPIHVVGAEPGDVLQVDILAVEPFLDWGWNRVAKGAGSLKYIDGGWSTFGLDLEARTVLLPWGGSIPWNITGTGPFFGSMGTAPPPEMGNVSRFPNMHQ
mmetsp:Transcript_34634/g.98142  ORF Transcript_34634/g.98142 Transcript_34634/m.98142 type:complete len:236 (-) Transcript_34634:1459-2166(-)